MELLKEWYRDPGTKGELRGSRERELPDEWYQTYREGVREVGLPFFGRNQKKCTHRLVKRPNEQKNKRMSTEIT